MFKRICAILVTLAMIISLVCCEIADYDSTNSPDSSEISEETTRKKDKIVLEENCDTTDFCVINGRMINFVSWDEISKLEASIAKLLSNELYPYGEGGDIYGYTCPDPDSPSVPESYSCGLMDVSGDGVPELLLHPYGYFGSSGTASYKIYDVYSGEYLGIIDDGIGIPWCTYYNIEEDNYSIVCQYYLRGGWPYRHYTHTELAYIKGEYCSRSFASSKHDIEVEQETDEDGHECWNEIYPNTRYYSDKYSDSLDGYNNSLFDFEQNYIRIPETELILIGWDEVCEYDEDQSVRAAKMARALVTSCQRIVAPDTIKLNVYIEEETEEMEGVLCN